MTSPLRLPSLLIVLGPPASGKTTLARRLAAHLSWPLMTKDTIKETLFETLGWRDRAWSQKLGHTSTLLLLQFAEVHLAAQQPSAVESNFYARYHAGDFLRLLARYPCVPIQVLCCADHAVLLDRYRRRAEAGGRHPGHMDSDVLATWSEEWVRAQSEPLSIGGHVIQVDTTDPTAVDCAALAARIGHLAALSAP